jgi:hypothetical protein
MARADLFFSVVMEQLSVSLIVAAAVVEGGHGLVIVEAPKIAHRPPCPSPLRCLGKCLRLLGFCVFTQRCF